MKTISLVGLLCLGALAPAQEIQFDYNRSVNFASYRTYQWVESKSAPNQLMDQNIKRAIDSQLALKGLQRVENGGDLQVGYQTALEQEKQFDGFGGGPRWGGTTRVSTSTIDIGKIAIEMVDSSTRQMVWRGGAEKTLDIKKDPDKNFKNLEKAMAKLFKNYPPGSEK